MGPLEAHGLYLHEMRMRPFMDYLHGGRVKWDPWRPWTLPSRDADAAVYELCLHGGLVMGPLEAMDFTFTSRGCRPFMDSTFTASGFFRAFGGHGLYLHVNKSGT
jgi:hypothetical protein